eukprot:COSAG02_NODE_1537_length_12050_cov_219.008116_4_plen_97_part_00
MAEPQQPKIVALVPMKHTSVRVRGKNYRMFQGQPLCYWVLKTLRACPRIDQIVIDTDSPVSAMWYSRVWHSVDQCEVVGRSAHSARASAPAGVCAQ